MDILDWLMNNGTVLDGTVICRILVIGLVFEMFGITSYWLRRF